MPVKKGTNNFSNHQDEKVAYLCERLDVHLDKFRQSKMHFEMLGSLIDELCPLLTEDLHVKWLEGNKSKKEPKPVSKSTLYRNVHYREKLDLYMTGLPSRGGINLAMSKKNLPMAKAKITGLQAEVSNLRNKLSILERYIEKSGLDEQKENQKQTKELTHDQTYINDYSLTAQALSLLLEATEGQFIEQEGQIINAGKLVNNVVVNKKQLSPYLNWLKKQGEING
jgi:hypothetical protein